MLELLLLWALLGLLPAAVARSRGLDFLTWWLYGALIWPVALIHVFFAGPDSVRISSATTAPRTCPFCAEQILPAAKVCKHCGRDLPVAAAPIRLAPIKPGAVGVCARCSRPIFPSSVRCGFCGAGIAADQVKRILVVLLCLVAMPPGSASAGPQNDPRQYCAGVFQSYDSQLRCVQRETAARDRLYRRNGSFNSQVPTEIWNYCGGVFDSWDSMERCIGREEQAKRSLGR